MQHLLKVLAATVAILIAPSAAWAANLSSHDGKRTPPSADAAGWKICRDRPFLPDGCGSQARENF
jgi:hypothetical protein